MNRQALEKAKRAAVSIPEDVIIRIIEAYEAEVRRQRDEEWFALEMNDGQ